MALNGDGHPLIVVTHDGSHATGIGGDWRNTDDGGGRGVDVLRSATLEAPDETIFGIYHLTYLPQYEIDRSAAAATCASLHCSGVARGLSG